VTATRRKWHRPAAASLVAVATVFWLWFGIGSAVVEGSGLRNWLAHILVPGCVLMVSGLIAWRWQGVGGALLLLEGLVALGAIVSAFLAAGFIASGLVLMWLTLGFPPLTAGVLLLAAGRKPGEVRHTAGRSRSPTGRLADKAHLIVLGAGLLNLAAMPFWRLTVARAVGQTVGSGLFGLGLTLNLLSLVALGRGVGGRVAPVTELVTRGVYARVRHPMYLSFAIIMLALDLLAVSILGLLFTVALFLPSMVWRARLEERALARSFGEAWEGYAASVPSLILWDLRKAKRSEG
jgi:protein-S-isoprenylcysteine O-methyltransferase Ste14